MTERYQIICPDCRTEVSTRDNQTAAKICPTCKKDITDSFEILFQPNAQSPLQKRIALVVLILLTLIIVVALAATYL